MEEARVPKNTKEEGCTERMLCILLFTARAMASLGCVTPPGEVFVEMQKQENCFKLEKFE